MFWATVYCFFIGSFIINPDERQQQKSLGHRETSETESVRQGNSISEHSFIMSSFLLYSRVFLHWFVPLFRRNEPTSRTNFVTLRNAYFSNQQSLFPLKETTNKREIRPENEESEPVIIKSFLVLLYFKCPPSFRSFSSIFFIWRFFFCAWTSKLVIMWRLMNPLYPFPLSLIFFSTVFSVSSCVSVYVSVWSVLKARLFLLFQPGPSYFPIAFFFPPFPFLFQEEQIGLTKQRRLWKETANK